MLRVRYVLRGTGEERALSWADSSGLAEVSVPPGTEDTAIEGAKEKQQTSLCKGWSCSAALPVLLPPALCANLKRVADTG